MRSLFSKRLAFVPKSVEVIVNAGPLGNWWLWPFLLVGAKTTELPLSDSAGNSFSWFSQTGIVNIQISHLTFICLGEAPSRGPQIRGAVPLRPKDKGLTISYCPKCQLSREALDIRQTERLTNQRILNAGHTAAHLCTGDSTELSCTSWYDQPALLGAQDAQLLLPRVSKLITGNTLIKDSEFLNSPLWVFKG